MEKLATQEELKKAALNEKARYQNQNQNAGAQTGQSGGSVSLQKTSQQAASPSAAADWSSQSGIAGLSDMTRQGLTQYGRAYTPSQTVNSAREYLQGVMSGSPGSYGSKYSGQIEKLYNEIMNRPKFQYDVNKDPLYFQYKNQYTAAGQKAMRDAMGTAAGLSGGYGSSWGNMAASQAYQAYMQQLADKVPELEQRAYGRYQDEGEEMRRNMDMNTSLDQMDYGRYRDTVADWQADRAFAASLYGQERTWDQSDWQAAQNYYTTMAGLENNSYLNRLELAYKYDEAGRNNDIEWAKLAEDARQANQANEYNYANLGETSRYHDQSNDYNYAQLAEDQRQADLQAAYWQDQLAENARQYNQSFEEEQRQYDQTSALNYAKLSEDQRQADLQAAYWQDQLAENARQYNQSFEEEQRQYDATSALNYEKLSEDQRQADLQAAYWQDQLAENARQANQANELDYAKLSEDQRQADLQAAYWQDQLAENARQYNQSFEEEQRQYDANMDYKYYGTGLDEAYRRDTMAQNQSQWEAEHQLNRDKYDFGVRQYEDELAALEAAKAGSGGGWGGSGSESSKEKTEGTAAGKSGEDMVLLPLNPGYTIDQGQGPRAEYLTMQRSEAEELLDKLEKTYSAEQQRTQQKKDPLSLQGMQDLESKLRASQNKKKAQTKTGTARTYEDDLQSILAEFGS